jgi:hypothetical protein
MKIKQVTARSGRTVPHPTRSFSNIKTDIELVAELDADDDPDASIHALRIQAEQIVQTHQEQVCESIRKGVEIVATQSRIEQLEAELEVLRQREKSHQGLLFTTTEVNVNEREEW